MLKIPWNAYKYIKAWKVESFVLDCKAWIKEANLALKEMESVPPSPDKEKIIKDLNKTKQAGEENINIIEQAKIEASKPHEWWSNENIKPQKWNETVKADAVSDSQKELKFDWKDYDSHVQSKLTVENCQIPLKWDHHEYHLFDKNWNEIKREDFSDSKQKEMTIETYKNSTKQNNDLLEWRDCVNKSWFWFSKDLKVAWDNDLVVWLNKIFENWEIKQEFKDKIKKLVEAQQKWEIEWLKFTHNVKQKDIKVDFSKIDLNDMDWDVIWKDIKPMIENKSLRINYQNKVDVWWWEYKWIIDTEVFVEDWKWIFEIDPNKSILVDMWDGIKQKYLTPEWYLPYAKDLIATDLKKEFWDEANKLKIAKRIDDMMDAIDVIDIQTWQKPRWTLEKILDFITDKLWFWKNWEGLTMSSTEKLVEILKSSDRFKDPKNPLNKEYKDAVNYLTEAIKAQIIAPRWWEFYSGSLIEFRMITEKLKSDIKEFKNSPSEGKRIDLQNRINDLKKYDFTDKNKFAFFNEVHLLTTQESYSLNITWTIPK